jgi:hypothetical protein
MREEAGELRRSRRCEKGSEQRGAPRRHTVGFKVKEGFTAPETRQLLVCEETGCLLATR